MHTVIAKALAAAAIGFIEITQTTQYLAESPSTVGCAPVLLFRNSLYFKPFFSEWRQISPGYTCRHMKSLLFTIVSDMNCV